MQELLKKIIKNKSDRSFMDGSLLLKFSIDFFPALTNGEMAVSL
jgi:hypothetical protein